MPLERADAFAFVRMLYEAGALDLLLNPVAAAAGGGRAGDGAQLPQQPGTRHLDSVLNELGRLDLDELDEFIEAAGPLVRFLVQEPEVFRGLLNTRLVQRKLGGSPPVAADVS